MAKDCIKLVYVASTGRSGSTLLEMLLGAHSSVASLGEIHLWPHEITRGGPTKPCGCGREIPDCSFWQTMRRRVDPLVQSSPPINAFRERHDGGKTFRPSKLGTFVTSCHPIDGKAIATFGANNEAVFRAFRDTWAEFEGTRPRWVVDASKDPYRFRWLVESGRFDITLLHVTKDPRSYVYSEGRRLWHEPDGGRHLLKRRLRLVARKSMVWNVVNKLIIEGARHRIPSDRYLHVSYEKLAREPLEVMEQVCTAVGCQFEPEVIGDFRARQGHSMAGNRMRRDTRPVTLDEAWQISLPSYAQQLASAITAPLRPRFGY